MPSFQVIANLLWVASWVALVVLGARGFVVETEGKRRLTFAGTFVAAMTAAVQGLFPLAMQIGLFPAGIYLGFARLFLNTSMENSRGMMGAAAVGWCAYLALGFIYVGASGPRTRKVVWAILLAIFLLNIAGCDEAVRAVRSIP
jgi:hypothetical protein